MTKQTTVVTLRLPNKTAKRLAAMKPNKNAWARRVIEAALPPEEIDWEEHFRWRNRKGAKRVDYRLGDACRAEDNKL